MCKGDRYIDPFGFNEVGRAQRTREGFGYSSLISVEVTQDTSPPQLTSSRPSAEHLCVSQGQDSFIFLSPGVFQEG